MSAIATRDDSAGHRVWRAPFARDAVVALVAFALTLLLLAHGAHGGPVPTAGRPRGLDVLGVALAGIACLALPWHRRWPLGVFVVSTAASATINGLGYGLGPPFGATVALFYLAVDERTGDRLRQTGVVVALLAAIHVAATTLSETGLPTTPALGAVVLWGGAWIVGDQLRQRRQRSADRAERAARTERDAERERRLAVAEERTRIARDLHDSAAHAINVILVQAGGARLLQNSDPGAVRVALSTIEEVARDTISDIDRLIRGLRADGAALGANLAVEPPAGMAAVPALAERYRAAGLAVEMSVHGTPRPLAPGLDQAAFRIVQESLTNAARHGSGPAAVQIAYADRSLELTVSNPRPPTANGGPEVGGHGLQGMRERAALLDGTLAVDRQDGRFSVHASLPHPPADEQPR
ncbi:MAG TPA: histidine kinase [Solirubrobacteraceae bacterium]|nr:histidine kinase [Solirubrobacteraceae bacterium]